MSGREGRGTHQDTGIEVPEARSEFPHPLLPTPQIIHKIVSICAFDGKSNQAFTNHSKELSHSVKVKKAALN